MSKLTQEEADLEASLSSAPTEVAEFAEQDGGLIRKAQHVLLADCRRRGKPARHLHRSARRLGSRQMDFARKPRHMS